MERVIVTCPMAGIFGMQVCACKDATDEEILKTCNVENPAGTMHGWSDVVREVREGDPDYKERHLPVQCEVHPDRMHFIIYC